MITTRSAMIMISTKHIVVLPATIAGRTVGQSSITIPITITITITVTSIRERTVITWITWIAVMPNSGACGSEMGNAGYPGGPGGGRGDGLGGGLGGYPGGASDWATTPSGNLDADTSALEEQVLLRAPPDVVKDFANKVATEAQSQGNNAAFSFAHNLAQSLTGSFSLANTQKAFDALPTEAGTTLNGHASGANVDFAQADQAGFNQLKKDIQDGNKKAVVNDIQTALKHNEITAADAKTLIGETGMNFHSGIMPGFKTGTEKEADILNGGKKADFS